MFSRHHRCKQGTAELLCVVTILHTVLLHITAGAHRECLKTWDNKTDWSWKLRLLFWRFLFNRCQSNINWGMGGAPDVLRRAWSHLCVCVFVFQAAADKVKEGDRLVSAGKMNNSDRKCMNQRLSCMSYALQGNSTHRHTHTHHPKIPANPKVKVISLIKLSAPGEI